MTLSNNLLQGHEVDLYFPSLQMLSNLIRTSTTSMTSVPKPLKFLREHYPALKQVYEKIKDAKTKQFCADVVSVLAMGVSGSPVSIPSLQYLYNSGIIKNVQKKVCEIANQHITRLFIDYLANQFCLIDEFNLYLCTLG